MSGKLVTVFGATGAQGNAVARALLARAFKVRAITRNPDSDKAKSLESIGIEVIKASLDDDAAKLSTALAGSDGVFILTNFWEYLDAEREFAQGKTAIDAAKAAGVQHVVYSGLSRTEKLSGLRVPHFEGKGLVEEYLFASEIPFKTSVRYPAYYDNFLTDAGKATKQKDDSYVIPIPVGDSPIHGIGVEDAGPCVAALFENPEEFNGKTIGLSAAYLRVAEYAAILSKHLGKKFVQIPMSWQDFRKLPFPAADDIGTMYGFFMTEHFKRDVALTKKLNPNVQSFEEFVLTNFKQFKETYP